MTAKAAPGRVPAVGLPACLLLAGISAILPSAGCDTAAQDIGELFEFNQPSPTEAATWMFDPYSAEKRRVGMTLIANAPFGGEEPYLKVYREAITDADSMVRAAAAKALALHGEPSDAPALAALLADSSHLVRWEAAKGLQRLHHADAVAPLIQAMRQDEDLDVRMAAANALGQYAEPRVVEALVGALDDRSVGVSFHAQRSLRILTGQDFGADPDAWLEWYRTAPEPFAGRRDYRYPVYYRDLAWYEKILPFGPAEFEQPATPAGFGGEGAQDAGAATQSDDSTAPPADAAQTPTLNHPK